jgi:hypothetical protein
MKHLWHLWSLALGEKAHKNDRVADKVAFVRTIIFTTYLITNGFIVANAIRHWNDREIKVEVIIYEDSNRNQNTYSEEWNYLGVARNSTTEKVY